MFQMRDISPQDCSGVRTTNCYIGSESNNCSPGRGLFARCDAAADNQEVQHFLENIRDLNASRALSLVVEGRRTFTEATYAPVADILIGLNIFDYEYFDMSMIRSLRLPILTQIALYNCANVMIGRNDFGFFSRLTSLMMINSTVARIEQGAFDTLPLLREIFFDNSIPLNTKMTSAQKEHLRLLHCDCQYKWLRVYLVKNQKLIVEKQDKEVYDLGGLSSISKTIRDLYAPIDCNKNDLIGKMSQLPFSINDPCS